MYCPVCFNDTLKLNSSGVVQVIVNGKQMDAGRFLYSLSMDQFEIHSQFRKKLEDFFKWYSNFKNQDPIQKVQILTGDISCTTGCRLPINLKVSVVDIVISQAELNRNLEQLGKKYNMQIELVTQV